jgi:hypothetical protein
MEGEPRVGGRDGQEREVRPVGDLNAGARSAESERRKNSKEAPEREHHQS